MCSHTFRIVSVKRYLGVARIHIYRAGIPPDRWNAGSDNNKSALSVSDLQSLADRRHGHECVKSLVKSWPGSQFMVEKCNLAKQAWSERKDPHCVKDEHSAEKIKKITM